MDRPTLSVTEAAKLLGVHANTIRYRLIKQHLYKHSKVPTPTGAVYMIDAADFYRQHPDVAPEGWTPVEVIDAEESSVVYRLSLDDFHQAVREAVALEATPLHEALRVMHEDAMILHEDNRMLREQMVQLQLKQQQAVIYDNTRPGRQGRGVLRGLGRLLGL